MTRTLRKAEASAASYSNCILAPGLFSTPCAPPSLPQSVIIFGLASPCALSRFVAERGNTAGSPRARRCGIYPRFLFPPLVWLLPWQTCFSPFCPPLKFLPVDSFSLPPHSFILVFVLLFALRRLSYVCVYFCRLTLVPYTTIPGPLAVTRTGETPLPLAQESPRRTLQPACRPQML